MTLTDMPITSGERFSLRGLLGIALSRMARVFMFSVRSCKRIVLLRPAIDFCSLREQSNCIAGEIKIDDRRHALASKLLRAVNARSNEARPIDDPTGIDNLNHQDFIYHSRNPQRFPLSIRDRSDGRDSRVNRHQRLLHSN